MNTALFLYRHIHAYITERYNDIVHHHTTNNNYNGDDNIVAIGYLESIANDENIKQYYKDEYSDKNVIESYSNFVKEEK